jgi:hypothetical protein
VVPVVPGVPVVPVAPVVPAVSVEPVVDRSTRPVSSYAGAWVSAALVSGL